MKVYREDSEIVKTKKAVVTVGSFDGLHLGHLRILDKVKEVAEQTNCTSFVVTFEPHPRLVLSQDYDMKLLTSLEEKKEILEKIGIENLLVINFSKEFSQLISDEFLKKFIVEKTDAAYMVIGHDHKFGRDRLGDENKLRNVGMLYNFQVAAVSPQTIDGEILSSTKIRTALAEGNIEKANSFLGRNYSISGTIVQGAQRGRLLGFPTANIRPHEPKKAVPMKGVYVVKCQLENESHYGIMNIGCRPTFENKRELVLEVHLLDFNRDIYGKSLKVYFLKRLRDENKFVSKEELIHQIEIDQQRAMEIIRSTNFCLCKQNSIWRNNK